MFETHLTSKVCWLDPTPDRNDEIHHQNTQQSHNIDARWTEQMKKMRVGVAVRMRTQ